VTPALEASAPALEARFDAIFRAELPYVVTSLRRLGARPADLEDLAHDVFVVVHRRLLDYDPSRPIRPWLFGIALRVAADDRRLARRRYERPDDGTTERAVSPGAEPERAALAAERRAMVQRGLDAIDLDKRALLLLHDIDGEPMPQIAHALGIPLNTAYSRLRLARERFREAIRTVEGARS
jgi:RNA polymerase sigma-70 factor (ECF subfamily)